MNKLIIKIFISDFSYQPQHLELGINFEYHCPIMAFESLRSLFGVKRENIKPQPPVLRKDIANQFPKPNKPQLSPKILARLPKQKPATDDPYSKYFGSDASWLIKGLAEKHDLAVKKEKERQARLQSKVTMFGGAEKDELTFRRALSGRDRIQPKRQESIFTQLREIDREKVRKRAQKEKNRFVDPYEQNKLNEFLKTIGVNS